MLFLFLPVLVICAIVFSWFPMQSGAAWIGFLTAYAGMLVLTTGAFELYYYFAGKKYDGILGQYRTKMKQRDEPDVPQGNDPV